ncbi:VCBS repeat-containing protein [Azonexus sp.]|uniref:VCBS repeat-containing protein n=1 Tax=Azonexus sp. TaxID=1872668 RepID=UPI0035AEC321
MKIASANLQMVSSHESFEHREVTESLNMWVGQRRPAAAEDNAARRGPPADVVTLSAAGRQAAAAAPAEAGQTDAAPVDTEAAIDADPKLTLLRTMIEFLTGRRLLVIDAGDLQASSSAALDAPAAAAQPPASAGFGIEYDYRESYTETEQTTFAASGTVRTADGREISFDLQLSMSRLYHEESSVSLRAGDAVRATDPLVLNFAGTAAQLTDQRFAFDLDADGSADQINFAAPGSGFLVFDRNANGKVDNGRELFGPTSGDGFQELAALDGDGNGWIDENDAAYAQLLVWSRDAAGLEGLLSLAAAGVGAIALARIATPFSVKTEANELLGQIRSSGIFLQEDGTAGTIQQIDLTA